MSTELTSEEVLLDVISKSAVDNRTWIIDKWLWPSVRMSWEYDSILSANLTSETFIPLPRLVLSDPELARTLSPRLTCNSETGTIFLLRADPSEIPGTMQTIENFAISNQCELTRFEKADKILLYTITGPN